MGGYLAEIKSVEQEAALDGLLSYSAEYWIGLSDLSVEGADTNTEEGETVLDSHYLVSSSNM